VFAAGITRRWQDFAALPVGLAVAVLWLPPEPAVAGGLVALVTMSQLGRPGWRIVGAVGAGALAGLWTVWLRGWGLPTFPALIMSAAVPAVSAWLSLRQPSFAPVRIREDAMFAVGVLGLVVAVGPTVTAGWSSAAALNVSRVGAGATGPGPWLFVAGAGVMLIGGVHSLWRRR
jgi:hypothetical protein